MKPATAAGGLALATLALAAGPAGGQQEGGDRRGSDRAAPDTAAHWAVTGLRPLRPDTAADRAREADDDAWPRWRRRLVGLAALFASDLGVRRAARNFDEATAEGTLPAELSEIGNELGTWKTTAPFLVGGALAGGAVLDGTRGLGRGASLLAGVLAGSMASEGLNRMTGRARPSWDRGALSLRPFSGHASFPSGHAAYLFSVAGGVDALTDGWLPAAAAYGAAGLSAYGRLYADRHWLSDVVVGAVIGSLVSRRVTRRAMRLLGVADEDGSGDGDRPAGVPDDRTAPPDRGAEISLLATPTRLGVRIRF